MDYERSSWRHMRYERSFEKEDLDAFKIGGTYHTECDTMEGEIPEFKNYGLKGDCMKTVIYDTSTPEENKFNTISDFKDCIIRGGEVVVRWKNEQLFIFKDSDGFCLVGTNVNGNIHRNTTDEVLEYVIGDDRLRDVIMQVTVWDRTI